MEASLFSRSRESDESLRLSEMMGVSSCFTVAVTSGACTSAVDGITGVDFPVICQHTLSTS